LSTASRGTGARSAATPPLKDCSLLFEFWLIQQATYPLIDTAMAGSGISSPDQLGMYFLLDEFGTMTPGEIAKQSGMRPNTVSVSLNRLEKRGHIARRPNPLDGRSVIIELSDAGRTALLDAVEGVRRLEDRIGTLVDMEDARDHVLEFQRAVRVLANLPDRKHD
jgi:DNA-binding MarR family transcriptional regulator